MGTVVPAAGEHPAALLGELLAGAERCFFAGNLVMADWLCGEVQQADPDNSEASHLLGLIAERQGRLGDALGLYRKALAASPHFTVAWLSLASLHRTVGQRSAAILCYRCLLSVDPADADGWYNLGNVLFDGTFAEAAAQAYRRALRLEPGRQQTWHNLGVAFHALGQNRAALEAFQTAVSLQPDYPASYHHIALIRFRVGDLDGSLRALQQQGHLAPADLDGNLTRLLAIGLRDKGRTWEAIPITALAVAHHAEDVDLRHCLGMLYSALRDLPMAETIFRTALCYNPADPFTLNSYGVLLNGNGDPQGGARLLGRSLLLHPTGAEIHSNLLLFRQYDSSLSAADLKREHMAWHRRHGAGALLPPVPRSADPERRLRIGYVSADFGNHPVGFFLIGVIARHDRSAFDVSCYSPRRHSDEMTGRFRTLADHWHDIAYVDGHALAQRIRDDGIDILVDLSGHTADNRLLAFSHRPAPIQATWAGYVGTTGVPTIDYLISDSRQTPEGVDDDYVERIVRLPDCYVCYEPPPYAPPVGELPALRNGGITFGCFNNLAKIDEASIALWSTLLRGRPERKLRLHTFALDVPSVRERFAARFEAHGVEHHQLILHPATAHPELLDAYNSVDIALDPLAYSGGLTTLEALWMGVPVVTLPGQRFCTRHSLSHVNAAGLPALAAEDPSSYLDRVEGLADDIDRLAELRATLRERMAASPLCDTRRFTRNLEAAYRQMWQHWCAEAGQP